MCRDDDVEKYLNAVDAYSKEKLAAATAWKRAFLSLAKARLHQEVSTALHDPAAKASLDYDQRNGKLVLKEEPKSFMGAWPSIALKTARDDFITALQHELEALKHNREQQAAIP